MIDAPADRPASMRRDLASAYLAAGARVGSWAIVSALVYRYIGSAEFAMLALIRGTIGLLNYTSLGLAPAMISEAARIRSDSPAVLLKAPEQRLILPYERQQPASPMQVLFGTARWVTVFSFVVGVALVFTYALAFGHLYHIPPRLRSELTPAVGWMGMGVLLRLLSDPSGAVLQLRGRIALDNFYLGGGDLLWVALAATLTGIVRDPIDRLNCVAASYAISGMIIALARGALAMSELKIELRTRSLFDFALARSLLAAGGLITLGQLADYLYAPTDYILIDRLLSPLDLASYAPAVQIDAGLLLLVTGLSSVLLPKAAIAHAGGSIQKVRRYYIRGTLAGAGVLAIASVFVWAISGWLLELWFGNSMPATRSILPLVLTHTVLGGSSAVGRSILLAVGRIKAFTAAVLISGVTNVICSFAFVHYLHWGLRGIVLGTIVAVVGRCVIWMPWYVLRSLKQLDSESGRAALAGNQTLDRA